MYPRTAVSEKVDLNMTREEIRGENMTTRVAPIVNNAMMLIGQLLRLKEERKIFEEGGQGLTHQEWQRRKGKYDELERQMQKAISEAQWSLWQIMKESFAAAIVKKTQEMEGPQSRELRGYERKMSRWKSDFVRYRPIQKHTIAIAMADVGIDVARDRPRRSLGLLGDLGHLAFQGFTSFFGLGRDKKLKKAIKVLQNQENLVEESVRDLQDDMVAVAKVNLEQFKKIKTAIDDTNERVYAIVQDIKNIENGFEEFAGEIDQMHYALFYLATVVGSLFPATERILSMYEVMIDELETIMSALDDLSNGQLSHNIVQPGQMKNIINQVQGHLREKYNGYSLIMTDVQEYYDLPQASFKYSEGMIIIHMPMYVSNDEIVPLHLYNLKTVPVPWDMKRLPHEGQKATTDSYTWLTPSHPLLAMSMSTYMALDRDQLHNCYRGRNLYLCEQTFLIQKSTDHTCESAIYYDMPDEYILRLCNFTFFLDLHPEPRILDSGGTVLLANVPNQWRFNCPGDGLGPRDKIGGKYVMIDKSNLCMCEIEVGKFRIKGSITNCKTGDMRGRFKLTYTINQAVLLNFPKEAPGIDRRQDILLSKPHNGSFKLPPIESTHNMDVLEHSKLTTAPLEKVIRALRQNYTLMRTKADKALLLEDEDEESLWDSIFNVKTLIIVVLILVILALLACFYRTALLRMFMGGRELLVRGLVKRYDPDKGKAWKNRAIKRIVPKERLPGSTENIEMTSIPTVQDRVLPDPGGASGTMSFSVPPERVAMLMTVPPTVPKVPVAPPKPARRKSKEKLYPSLQEDMKLYYCPRCHNAGSQHPCPVCVQDLHPKIYYCPNCHNAGPKHPCPFCPPEPDNYTPV
jgi:hypothetical protein